MQLWLLLGCWWPLRALWQQQGCQLWLQAQPGLSLRCWWRVLALQWWELALLWQAASQTGSKRLGSQVQMLAQRTLVAESGLGRLRGRHKMLM